MACDTMGEIKSLHTCSHISMILSSRFFVRVFLHLVSVVSREDLLDASPESLAIYFAIVVNTFGCTLDSVKEFLHVGSHDDEHNIWKSRIFLPSIRFGYHFISTPITHESRTGKSIRLYVYLRTILGFYSSPM